MLKQKYSCPKSIVIIYENTIKCSFPTHSLPDRVQRADTTAAAAAATGAAEIDCIAAGCSLALGWMPWAQNELRLVVAKQRFGILKKINMRRTV